MSDTPITPSQMKSNDWCITYWLTDGRTLETLNLLVSNMPSNWMIEGQIEQGEDSQKRLHAQLRLKTEHTRGTKVAKYFPNCYLAETKNKFQLHNYVHKEETRVGEFKTVENRSPQWRIVRDKFADWVITQYFDDRIDEEGKWKLWDTFIGISLEEGMEIDLIGVNPQYRSCINKYWKNIINMAFIRQQSNVDKCPDRQLKEPPITQFLEVPPVADPPFEKVRRVKLQKFIVSSKV